MIFIVALESGNYTSRGGGGGGGGLGQMSLVNWLPNVSTQSRVFISGNEIQGMVTYIPVRGGAGEMAMGGKLKGKVHVHKTNAKMNTQNWRCKNTIVKTMLVNDCQFHVTENTFECF